MHTPSYSSHPVQPNFQCPPTRSCSRTAQEHDDSRESTLSPPPLLPVKYYPTSPSGSPSMSSKRVLPPLDHPKVLHHGDGMQEHSTDVMDARVRADMMSHMDYFCTRNKALAQQIQEAAERNYQLQLHLEQLTEDNIELHKKVDECEITNHRFRSFNEKLQEQLMESKDQCHISEEKVKEHWKNTKVLEEELIKLKEAHRIETTRAKETSDNLENTKQELKDMATALQNFVSREQNSKISINKLVEEERRKSRDRELDALGKITRLEEQMLSYTNKNGDLQTELEKLKTIQEDYKILQLKLANEEKRHLALAIKFRDMKDDNARLRQMRRGSIGAESDGSNSSGGDGTFGHGGGRKNVLSNTLPNHPHLGLIDLDLQKPNTRTVPHITKRGVSPKKGRQTEHLPVVKK